MEDLFKIRLPIQFGIWHAVLRKQPSKGDGLQNAVYVFRKKKLARPTQIFCLKYWLMLHSDEGIAYYQAFLNHWYISKRCTGIVDYHISIYDSCFP